MNIEKNQISSKQLMIYMVGFIVSSRGLLAFAVPYAKQNTWIAIILGGIISIVFINTYTSLALAYPNQNLVQIMRSIYGNAFGNIISLLYVWFFLSLATFNLWHISDFIINLIMPETPDIVFLILFTATATYAVRKGLSVVVSSSIIFFLVTVIEIIITSTLMLKDMNISNLLPIGNISLYNLLHSSHIITAIPVGESIVFLFFINCTKEKQEVKKSLLKGLALGIVILCIVQVRDILMLGNTLHIETYPDYEAVRLINIGDIVNRMEILMVIAFVQVVFIKFAAYYYASCVGIGEIFNLRSYKYIAIPVGILLVIINVMEFDFNLNVNYFGANVFPVYSLPFELIIPLVTLMLSKFKKNEVNVP